MVEFLIFHIIGMLLFLRVTYKIGEINHYMRFTRGEVLPLMWFGWISLFIVIVVYSDTLFSNMKWGISSVTKEWLSKDMFIYKKED